MSRIKRGIFILFFAETFLCFLLGAGCWNLREPQAQAVVMALAVDLDEESGLFEVVVEVGVPSALVGGGDGGGGGGGGGGEQPSEVVSAKGQTVFQALRRLETRMPRHLYWGHNSLIIFSEKLARQGIAEVLDFFERERYTRAITRPLVAQSDVKKLMQVRFPLEGTAGEGYVSQLTTLEASNTLIPPGDLGPVIMKLSQPGIEIFLPSVRLVKEEGSAGGEGGGGSGTGGEGGSGGGESKSAPSYKVVEMAGGAAFIEDRMVGWLGVEATLGWLWITGNLIRTTQVISCPDCSKGLSIDIIEYTSYMEPMISNGRPRVKVTVSIDGRIQDVGCRHATSIEQKDLGMTLNRRLEESVRKLMRQALEETRELGSDIFGFGREFYRRKPKEWHKMKDNWQRIFQEELEVEFEVEASVRRVGLILEPLQIR